MKHIKKILISVIVITLVFSLAACGSSVSNKTADKAAKTFIQAMIKGDEKTLNAINKSEPLMFPTSFLISEYAPKFADQKLKDYTFETDIDTGTVKATYKDGKSVYTLDIKKVGDKYYFMGFK